MNNDLTPEQQNINDGFIKFGEETQGIRHTNWYAEHAGGPTGKTTVIPPIRKPSLFARLFSRVGTKYKGWSKRQHD